MALHAPAVSYDRMLEHLYASVLDPTRFADFAAELRSALNSHLVAVQCDDLGHLHDVRQLYSRDLAGEAPPDFRNDAGINLFFVRGAARFAEHGVQDGAGLFAPGELERTAFYADVLAPADVHYSMGICLDVTPAGGIVCLTLSRDRRRPGFSEEDFRFAHRLRPHLRNACHLQQRFRELASTASVMDRVAYGIWLLGRDGGVVRANSAAQALLAEADGGLRQQGVLLASRWRADQGPLHMAIQHGVSRISAQRSDFLLHDAIGQAWAACTVHPLHANTLDGWLPARDAACIVLVHPLAKPVSPPKATLRDIFGLTQAETELANALLHGGSLADCTGRLNKQRETLRTQLKGLFAKTGTHSQAELLRRLASTE